MFSKLVIHHWRQFDRVEIDFHRRLTVLTGENGTGKTTLLHLLNRHWGWNLQYVSSPSPDRERPLRKYWAGFWGKDNKLVARPDVRESPERWQHYRIGEFTYRNGKKALLSAPVEVDEVFKVELDRGCEVAGVYVPSHRSPYLFQQLTEIPVTLDAKQQIFEVYLNEMMARFTSDTLEARALSGSDGPRPPSYHLKRSLVSLALFGYGNAAVEPNQEAIKTFEGFENILRVMLPMSLGFTKLKVRVPDVLLSTKSGDFSLEAVSGGVAAVIDMAWQIHMYAQLHDEFVVVIDEPEAHLHPALQQRLLPDLLAAFPKAQFVIATHSPFMVTSVPDSNVYVLKYNAEHKVDSELLDKANKAGSADEVLMEVLGVPSTIPQWAQTKINAIVDEFSKGPLTQESVSQLRTKMGGLGMGHLFPEVLATVAEGKP
jgi:predicted ATPase